jgi:hypothetical protein
MFHLFQSQEHRIFTQAITFVSRGGDSCVEMWEKTGFMCYAKVCTSTESTRIDWLRYGRVGGGGGTRDSKPM